MPRFELTFSDQYTVDLFRRYRQCQAIARLFTWLKFLIGLVLTVGVISGLLTRNFLGAAIFAALLAFLIFARRLDDRMFVRRFKKSPYYGEQFLVDLDENGLATKGNKCDAAYKWDAFSAARQFDDGILLFQGPGLLNWLPNSALVSGSIHEAEQIIRTNINDYKCV